MKIIFPAPVMKSHTLPKTILNHIRKVVFYKQEIHYQIGFPLFLINLLRIDAENKATKAQQIHSHQHQSLIFYS
jgi:hypothetical protein